MTLMEEVSKLQQRLAAAQRERARAEGAYETAMAIAERAREELRRDFGVDTVDGAERQLASMKEELESLIRQINVQLDKIGIA